MHLNNKPTRVKRSRTRSGCFTCRDRHMKCDEQLPVCQNCINSKRKCYRGIRLNFTQYTIYDPKEHAPSDFNARPRFFRILDQLVTISKLYADGRLRYRPYLHLHLAAELAEADRHFHQDSYVPVEERRPLPHFPDTTLPFLDMEWLDHPSPFGENVILENYDIKNVLMQPYPVDSYSPVLETLKTRQQSQDTIPLSAMFVDARGYIALQRSRFYWVLDLFNEINVWKVLVPSYCVRFVQEADEPCSSFLMDCLLGTEYLPVLALHNAQQQLSLWQQIESRELKPLNYRAFERVLISVVLMLLGLLFRTTQLNFDYDPHFRMLLANQGRLFRKLVFAYARLPDNKARRNKTSVLTIASIQAVGVLRFFLKMQLGRHPTFGYAETPDYALLAPISYDMAGDADVGDFFTITDFELGLLRNNFRTLDMVQLDAKHSMPDARVASDSSKLRMCMWNVIKLDYLQNHPMANLAADRGFATASLAGTTALIPNDKCLALLILALYAYKLQGAPYEATTAKLHEIFHKISTLALAPDIKAQWSAHFAWTIAHL